MAVSPRTGPLRLQWALLLVCWVLAAGLSWAFGWPWWQLAALVLVPWAVLLAAAELRSRS